MKTALKGAMVAGALVMGTVAAHAQGFGNAYFLGDSLTDCCIFAFRATNGHQPNWSDQLPLAIGAHYTASAQTNLAVGGALTGRLNVVPSIDASVGMPTGFLSQVERFTTQGPTITPRDIVGVWIGTNDIWAAALSKANLFPTSAIVQPLGPQPAVSTFADYMAGNVRDGVNALIARGLRNIVLVSPIDISQTSAGVYYGTVDGTALSLEKLYSEAYRDRLAALYTPGVNTYFMDALTLVRKIQANPGIYGFDHVTAAENCLALQCDTLTLAQQNRILFLDGLHMNSGFNQLMTKYIANMINAREAFSAPGDMSQGAALTFSNGLMDRLDAQRRSERTSDLFNARAAYIPTKAPPAVISTPADKFSVFVEGIGASISRSSVPNPSGPSNSDLTTNFAGITIGADYRATPNLRVGGAFNFLNSSTDLPGLSKTHLDSNSFQGGLFASLSFAHFFLDTATTYGLSTFDTNRPGVIDTLNGSLNGNAFTFAGRAGYLFDAGSVRVGPIAELAYSNVHLGRYSERGDELLTLGVLGQTFDNLTGGAGAQLRASLPVAGGSFNPFVNLTAQHDFIGGVRAITSFSMDAPQLLINTTGGRPSSDLYGKVSGGFDVGLGGGLKGLLTVSSTFGRSGGDDHSVNGGLQYQF